MVKHKKKYKLNKKRIFFFIILPIAILLACKYSNKIANTVLEKFVNYDIAYLSQNSNYSGIGQENVDGKDGYYTTFTTVNSKIYTEYKQNGNSSWSNNPYWEGTMETDGCGITALSIVLSGYGKLDTPEDLRKKYYPFLNLDNISDELYNTYNISSSGFFYDYVRLSIKSIENHLKSDKPILICVWNKPKMNRWTTESHYLVLLATDENGKWYVSNPNGLPDTTKASGWYDIDEIQPYIAKALFIES